MGLKKKYIYYQDKYEEDGETTLYFIAPKTMLTDYFPKKKFPNAKGMQISVKLPTDKMEAKFVNGISVAPTDENGDAYRCVDINMPYEDIDVLLDIAIDYFEREAGKLNKRKVLSMRVEIDLTEEEIKMIWMALRDRGDTLYYQTLKEELRDKYYSLSDKFKNGTMEKIMKL